MFELIILVIVIFFSIFLAYLVYKSNPDSASNRAFVYLALSIIFWTVIMYLSLFFTDPVLILFFIRLSMLAATVLTIAAFIFAYTFPQRKFYFPLKIRIIYFILAPLTMLVSMSPYMFTELKITDSNIEPTPGPGMVLFVITAIGSIIATFIILIIKFIKAKSLQRTQYFFMILGVLLMFVLMVTTNFLTILVLKNSALIFLAPVYPLIFLVSTAYAIFRHRILDIRLLLVRAISYFVTISTLALLFSLSFLLFTNFFIQVPLNSSEVFYFLTISILFAIFFQRIKTVFEEKTEKFFYRNTLDTSKVLNELGKKVSATIEFNDLINKVGDVFVESIKVSSFYVILFGKDDYSQLFKDVKYVLPKEVERETVENFLRYIFAKKRTFYYDEEEENEKIKSGLTYLQISVAMPLIINNKLIGAYLVGSKASGETYSQKDIDVMQISAPQIAVGIQNALAFEEIRRFNVTLKEKVDNATIKLKHANERLKELDKLKDEFVSVASHELRTPMTSIKSYLWMAMAGKGGKIPDKVKYYLDRAYTSTDRLIKLVNDMLNISRIESGRISVNFEQVDMKKLIDDVVAEVLPRGQELSLEVQFEQPSEKTSTVVADGDKVKEVLINLIGNSMKFTPKKGKITVRLKQQEDEVITEVQDSGVGMDADTKASLFQKFGLIPGSYRTNQNVSLGTGLGLYISKSIIDLHNGKIWGESEGRDKGSTFGFNLPIFTKEKLRQMQAEHPNKTDLGIIHTKLS